MNSLGKSLILMGGLLAAAGLFLVLLDRTPLRLGRLPGDILWKGKQGTVYFPIVTCLLLSIVLTLVLNFLRRR